MLATDLAQDHLLTHHHDFVRNGNHLCTADLWMTVSTKRPLRPPRSPTASPLAVSFQTPELDLQVAIGQLFSQETEQRTEQPGLFQ